MSPDAIRAEHSEQEVAAAAYHYRVGFPILFFTGERAGPWYTVTSLVIEMPLLRPDARVPSLGLTDGAAII
ncbi:MAG: hypothetical protein CME31_20735 [Gimesia sp.]|nr:hypothetical protein [Gimesia sp.]